MPREYPEPSLFGILPAYGIYARHVTGLTVADVKLTTKVTDERPAVVLDDVSGATFAGFSAPAATGVPTFVRVTNTKKRVVDREYVKEQPYKTTTVSNVVLPSGAQVQDVTVDRPAPGTPPDSLYALPTAPSATYPYNYAVPDASYAVPLTVHRPHFDAIAAQTATVGQPLQFMVNAKTPASGVTLTYSAKNLPGGASFDANTRTFTWTPNSAQAGQYTVQFVVDDGVIPETRDVAITVTR
ncbi:MAG: putative Ig domain-containing protein [Rhodocyclaceae bacterium]